MGFPRVPLSSLCLTHMDNQPLLVTQKWKRYHDTTQKQLAAESCEIWWIYPAAFILIHLSGPPSHPIIKPTNRKCIETVWSPTVSTFGEAKNKKHMAYGVWQPGDCWQLPLKVGFYETGTIKSSIKHNRSDGGLLISPRKHQLILPNYTSHHSTRLHFTTHIWSSGLVCVQWKTQLCVCVCMFPTGKLHVCF